MIAEATSNPPAAAPSAPVVRMSTRGTRPWARTLAAGAVAVMAAFVTVQVGGCGFKTPLQLPKKAPPPKPAS